jgi:YcaO-like protein with predicted kinase domain
MDYNELLNHYCLNESIKKYKGYKVNSPEETIERIKKAFSKINLNARYEPHQMNILIEYTPFLSGSAFLYPKENSEKIILRTNGKGVTPRLSQASAIAELIERFTGYGLAGPFSGHYSASMKMKEIWLKKGLRNKHLEESLPFESINTLELIPPDRKDEYHTLAKSVCYSFTRKKLFCYPEEFFVNLCGSNGLASGNSKEEAILQATFECIERLCTFYVLDKLPECNKISAESVTHPTLIRLIKNVEKIGVKYQMLDFTYLFDIPVIITIFDHKDWNFPTGKYDPYLGYPIISTGVGTDPEDAAMRCFTEFLQGKLPVYDDISTGYKTGYKYSLSKLDIPPYIESRKRSAIPTMICGIAPESVNLRKYLDAERKEISIKDIKSIYDIDFKVEIEKVIEILKNKNIEVFCQDITNPYLSFPVVYVMVSGGEGYYSKIPLNGYECLVLGTDDRSKRYAYLNRLLEIITSRELRKPPIELFKKDWCHEVNQESLVSNIIDDLFDKGDNETLWGVPMNKFYFLALLYLRMKKYDEAMNCINACLCKDTQYLPAILTKAFLYSKLNQTENYNQIIDYADIINKEHIDLKEKLTELENPIIKNNPFELCDLKCKLKNKPNLCNNCFFGYVKEEVFLRTMIDELFMNEKIDDFPI